MVERDFVGYGPTPPSIQWPGNARIALCFCVNVEEGAESSPYFGDEQQALMGLIGQQSPRPPGVRNLAAETLWEYASRAGGWRILRIFEKYGVKATFYACGMALEQNPPYARAIGAGGHDVVGHGYRWLPQWHMEREEERAYIRKAADSLERTTGRRPIGWFSRSGPGLNTRELLSEEGFLYDTESFNDDLPYYVQVKDKPWLVLPYAFDTNDSAGNDWHTADHFVRYLKDTFDMLYEEGATHPKMLSVGIHTRVSGKAGRAVALDRFLEYVKGIPRVWIAGRDDVARWWLEHYPPKG